MADFDPKTDVLNNAINEPGWTILDVRNDEELIRDGNLRDAGAKNWVHIPTPEVQAALALSASDFEVSVGFLAKESKHAIRPSTKRQNCQKKTTLSCTV